MLEDSGHQKLFTHPTTLKLFLYGLKSDERINIRHVQRQLGIASSSSVHWHLNKLIDARLMVQHSDNSYSISDEGMRLKSLIIPIRTNFILFNGKVIPSQLFSLVFLLASLIITCILLLSRSVLVPIFLVLTLTIQLILVSKQLWKNWREYIQEYHSLGS